MLLKCNLRIFNSAIEGKKWGGWNSPILRIDSKLVAYEAEVKLIVTVDMSKQVASEM